MVIFGSRMEGHEEPSFWSKLRPGWVARRMVEKVEEKKKPEETQESPVHAGGAEEPNKEKKEEEAPGVSSGSKPKEKPEETPVPRLAEVEKELEEERRRSEELRRQLEEKTRAWDPQQEQREKDMREMAAMAARLAQEQEKQQQLTAEVRQRFGLQWMPPGGNPCPTLPPPWVAAGLAGMVQPSMMSPGMVVKRSPGAPAPPGQPMPGPGEAPPVRVATVPAAPMPAAMGPGSVPGMASGVPEHGYPGKGGQVEPKKGGQVAGVPKGEKGAAAPAAPTVKGTVGKTKQQMPQQTVLVKPIRRRDPVPVHPGVEPKQTSEVRQVVKKPTMPVTVDVDDKEIPADEEEDKEAWLREQVVAPRTMDGLTVEERARRVVEAERARERKAAMATESQKEQRYERPMETQMDRIERKMDWLVEKMNEKFEGERLPPPPPGGSSWSEAQVKQWLLEMRRNNPSWEAPTGKGRLMERALEEERHGGKGGRKRSYSWGEGEEWRGGSWKSWK